MYIYIPTYCVFVNIIIYTQKCTHIVIVIIITRVIFIKNRIGRKF